MVMIEEICFYFLYLVLVMGVVMVFVVLVYVVLCKCDVCVVIVWVVIIWIVLIVGFIVYVLFGVNCVNCCVLVFFGVDEELEVWFKFLLLCFLVQGLVGMMCFVDGLVCYKIVGGNLVNVFVGGDQVYDLMFVLIVCVEYFVMFCIYIFDFDLIGKQFIEVLVVVKVCGVEVWVFVDGVGGCYSWLIVVKILCC